MRFPEFEGEWEVKKLGEILKVGSGRDYKHLKEGNIPVFGTGGYMTSVNEFLFDGESVCIGRKGTINKPFYYNGKFWTVDTLFYTYSYKNVLPKFVFNVFEQINWLMYNEASGVPSLSKSIIEQIEISIPDISEQTKIASFLSLIDERITTQSKIIDRLESLIKAVNNKLLNCESNKIPSLRFPEFPEKWEVVPLKDIVLKVNTKNRDNKVNVVFSNSATQGLVLQNEYFDKEIANKDNLHEYYIVRPDDFVYNPRLSSNADVGAMSVNHTKYTGLVSPLYTVFRVENSNIDIIFLESIFKSKVWHNYMRSIANYGARDDRMNIRNDDFFDLPLYIPKKLEQQKISLFLSSLSLKMKNEKDILSIYKQQKAYLLNNLFI